MMGATMMARMAVGTTVGEDLVDVVVEALEEVAEEASAVDEVVVEDTGTGGEVLLTYRLLALGLLHD